MITKKYFLYPTEFSLPDFNVHYWSDKSPRECCDEKFEIGIEPDKYNVFEIEYVQKHKLQYPHSEIDSRFNFEDGLDDSGQYIRVKIDKPFHYYNLYAVSNGSEKHKSRLLLYIYTYSGFKSPNQIYKAFLLTKVVVSIDGGQPFSSKVDLCLSYDSVMTSKNFSQYKKKQEPRVHQILNSNILIQDVLRIVCQYDHIVF